MIYQSIVKYNPKTDTFILKGSLNESRILIDAFLKKNSGKPDKRPIVSRNNYVISVRLYTARSVFTCDHNCGNRWLRDGILQRFIACRVKK